MRDVDDGGDIREFARDSSAEYVVELIETLASGDNALTGADERFVSLSNPFGASKCLIHTFLHQ